MDTEWLHPSLVALFEEGFAFLDAGFDAPVETLAKVDRAIISTWPPPERQDEWGNDDWLDDDSPRADEPPEPSLREPASHFPWAHILRRAGFENAISYLDSGRVIPLARLWMLDSALLLRSPEHEEPAHFIPDDWL